MKNLLSFKLFESTSFDWRAFYEKGKEFDDWHQAILNHGYDEWQKRPQKWGYGEMLDYVENTMGKEARLLVQLGKYNQQVGNGGHLQYHDNRYDGSDGGKDDSMELHDMMLQMMEEFDYNKSEVGEKVYNLAKKFQIIPMSEDCPECGGSGVIEETDDDDDEEDDWSTYENKTNERFYGSFGCSYCNGTGEDPNDYELLIQPKDIDDQYYKLDDEWLKELENKSEEFILKNMLSHDVDLDDNDLEQIKNFF